MSTSSPHLDNLLDSYTLHKFKKGQTLLFQGEAPHATYVIRTGTVKAYNISPAGEEQVISLNSKCDIIPGAWFLGESETANYFYEAFTDCSVYAIGREELTQKINESLELSNVLLRRSMRLNVGASVYINALEQSRSRDKLIHLLHYLMLRYGIELGRSKVKINLQLTHQTLATMLGITRETIANEISQLRRERVINYGKQIYVVNRPALLQLCNDDNLVSRL